MSLIKLITTGSVVVALLLLVVIAATVLWPLAPEASSRAESAKITYNVEYVVRDANGKIKEQGSIHNAVNDPQALDEVFRRITGAAGGDSQDYDEIGALAVDNLSDDPANGVASTSVGLNLDGDSEVNGNQNPANGEVTTDFATDSGSGTVVVNFRATADSTEIKQIVLTKNSDDDTSDGTANIADSDIFAYVDVADIVMGENDSVTYTWTIDVD